MMLHCSADGYFDVVVIPDTENVTSYEEEEENQKVN